VFTNYLNFPSAWKLQSCISILQTFEILPSGFGWFGIWAQQVFTRAGSDVKENEVEFGRRMNLIEK
jgi:hypothetical protein